MTFVILLAATWFGFYLARQLSIPIVQLGRATRRVAEGDYTPLQIQTGSEEITDLITAFNQMTGTLEKTLQELDQQARYTNTVLKNVSAGVISVNEAGLVTTINRHAAQLLKLDPEKYIGRSVRDLLTLEYFRTFAELQKSMKDHKIESIQKEIRLNVQGEALPLLMTLSLLKDEKGQEIGKILVFDDLTPIANAQRAQAWTEVARRIAHEIKNPLTPIKLSAERLQRKFGPEIKDPAFSECTTMIVKQVDGLRNLVNEFSNFARLPQARPVLGSLNSVVEEALSLFRQAHPQIEFEFNQATELPDFKFDPDQMKRVLVNLLDNSASALSKMPKGIVKVTTQYDRDIKTVRMSVADNGPGIPAKERNRIFEPYYTTKESGTGLGLAIVKRIIEDHSGFIRAIANEPRGNKMVIEMPVHEVGAWKPAVE
jgi:two-component system nitrogen regulation sensor histidine kinase NtrY